MVEETIGPFSLATHGERTFLGLLIIFAIVAALAILGVVLEAAYGTSTTLISQAMQVIGYGGPAGSAANTAAEGLAHLGRTPAPPTPPSVPPSTGGSLIR